MRSRRRCGTRAAAPASRFLWHDVTFGARLLRRQPLFTATAVLSLSLGIGATTTIFTLVNAVLLRDLRVPDPRSLVEVGRTTQFGRGTAFSYPAYQRLRDETTVFTGLLALSKNTVSGNADGGASAAAGRFVSGNFFEVLGIAPAAGRLFSADDDHVDDAARAAVAVISYRFWQRAFGGTNVLGRTIRVEPVPFTIVGVRPRRSTMSSSAGAQTSLSRWRAKRWSAATAICATRRRTGSASSDAANPV